MIKKNLPMFRLFELLEYQLPTVLPCFGMSPLEYNGTDSKCQINYGHGNQEEV
jgi:hypothetical protein